MRYVPEDRYIQAHNLQVRYWTAGDNGSDVILIHGLAGSADIWQNNIASLSARHRVYALDLPGFGQSGIPSASFSPSDYSLILDDFMAALGIDQADVVGQSLGGGIALHYTLGFPEKVRRLVLVDSAGLGAEVIWTLKLMSLPLFGELFSYPSRRGVKLFFKFAVRDQSLITADFVDCYYTFFCRPGFQAFLLRLLRGMVNMRGIRREVLGPVMNSLEKIRQPVLIVWGEHDRVFPLSHAYAGARRFQNAKLETIEATGHLPFFERADIFNRLVLDFLGEP
jgi:4,5:9,10-diseco-3-hydroxy-5,9,17-trioxoandrosta-1(10),2-diene-4-oate hydrolase